jgi:hypothetical protein
MRAVIGFCSYRRHFFRIALLDYFTIFAIWYTYSWQEDEGFTFLRRLRSRSPIFAGEPLGVEVFMVVLLIVYGHEGSIFAFFF